MIIQVDEDEAVVWLGLRPDEFVFDRATRAIGLQKKVDIPATPHREAYTIDYLIVIAAEIRAMDIIPPATSQDQTRWYMIWMANCPPGILK